MDLIDPNSPVPLYHQIAEAIRDRIHRGELEEGDALTPLREAARSFGVNIHTVRHAYTALAREGLLAPGRGLRRTRVAGGVSRTPVDADPRAFVARVIETARREYGLAAHELVDLIGQAGAPALDTSVVYVVECTQWQSECHALELNEAWRVDAKPWPLEKGVEPPADPIVSTYFHYNDIRRLWPHRLQQIHFVTIRPALSVVDALQTRLPGVGRKIVRVCERDAPTAENTAADLSAVVTAGMARIERVVSDDPAAELDRAAGDGAVVLFSPRVWSGLSSDDRRHRCAVEVRYEFDQAELQAVGRKLNWTPTGKRESRAAEVDGARS